MRGPLRSRPVLLGMARWLELRSAEGGGERRAFVWPACLALVGLVLLFYREG